MRHRVGGNEKTHSDPTAATPFDTPPVFKDLPREAFRFSTFPDSGPTPPAGQVQQAIYVGFRKFWLSRVTFMHARLGEALRRQRGTFQSQRLPLRYLESSERC